MDVNRMLQDLREEREQLDEAIASLERLARARGSRRGRPPAWLREARSRKAGRPPGKASAAVAKAAAQG